MSDIKKSSPIQITATMRGDLLREAKNRGFNSPVALIEAAVTAHLESVAAETKEPRGKTVAQEVKLPPELFDALRREAHNYGCTTAELIRQCISKELKKP